MPAPANTTPALVQRLRQVLRLAERWERLQATRTRAAPPDVSPEASPFRVAHYGNTRFWALYEGDTLLGVTVYKRGAESLRQALVARDTVIAAQAAQMAQLMAASEPCAAGRTHVQEQADHDAQLAFFAEEERARSRVPSPGTSPGRG
jgi:glycine/D-amino acid oxidase-like deaminating enzyme